jgi:hypothetical protein
MMTFEQVGEFVFAEPFRPFRIKMASGQTFEIRHPETILIGRTTVQVYTAAGTDAAPAWHDVSLMLMEALEPVNSPQTHAN